VVGKRPGRDKEKFDGSEFQQLRSAAIYPGMLLIDKRQLEGNPQDDRISQGKRHFKSALIRVWNR